MPKAITTPLTPEQNTLILQWPALPAFVMNKYPACWCRLDWDTAHSHAEDAMMNAARRYNPAKGKFSTYATKCIRLHLTKQNRREGVVVDKNRDRQVEPLSFVFMIGEDGADVQILKNLADSHDDSAECVAADERRFIIRVVQNAIGELFKHSERQATVIRLRMEGQTLKSIGEHLGVTRERVRQMEAQAYIFLREKLGEILSGAGCIGEDAGGQGRQGQL